MDRLRALLRCLLLLTATRLPASPGLLRLLPGLQPDGSTLLHNQWSIRPAGRQVELGNFPTGLAVHPDGRWAAVLHCGAGPHEVRIVDLNTGAITATATVNEAFYGIAFSGDGRTLVCSGASDEVLHVFDFHDGRLAARPDVVLAPRTATDVPAGFALSRNAKTAIVACLWGQRVMRVDLAAHHVVWECPFGAAAAGWDGGLAGRPAAGRRLERPHAAGRQRAAVCRGVGGAPPPRVRESVGLVRDRGPFRPGRLDPRALAGGRPAG